MIALSNLDYQYTNGSKVFDQLNLKLDVGKIYGLLGRNGVGKSTLLKLISGGLISNNGEIKVGNYNPIQRRPEMYREIFYLPEELPISHLNIKSYISAHEDLYPKFDKAIFNHILSQFEVDNDKKLNALSYGQHKKFHIAFGLACKTKYIFLDEPTNGLDIPSKGQFRKVLASHMTEDQIIIISTHQVKDLTNLIESIIILEEGNIMLSKDLFEIETKLEFQYSTLRDDSSHSVYVERTTGGYIHIQPNHNEEPSEIDLEILFNGVLHRREELLTILNS